VTTTFGGGGSAARPVLGVLLLTGLLVGFGALIARLQGLAFGPSEGGGKASPVALAPLFAHFALVLAAGLYLPPALVAWFQKVAELLG
jgi:hydrogenase-4 component F